MCTKVFINSSRRWKDIAIASSYIADMNNDELLFLSSNIDSNLASDVTLKLSVRRTEFQGRLLITTTFYRALTLV
jgi:hypothetical protein